MVDSTIPANRECHSRFAGILLPIRGNGGGIILRRLLNETRHSKLVTRNSKLQMLAQIQQKRLDLREGFC